MIRRWCYECALQLLKTLRIGILLCGLLIGILACLPGVSWWFCVVVNSLVVVGVMACLGDKWPGGTRFRRVLICFAGAIAVTLILWRAVTPIKGEGVFRRYVAFPYWKTLARIVPEKDGVITAFRFLRIIRGITAEEYNGLLPALEVEYDRMSQRTGDQPTPLIRSWLLLQGLGDHDLLVHRDSGPYRGSVVFLHGVGGNWTLGCWLVAEAAAEAGLATYCPSTGVLGLWTSSQGRRAVRGAIERSEAEIGGPIFLAGLSAGAVSAGILAPEFRERLAGTILLFGGHPRAASAGIQTFLMLSESDQRFPKGLMDSIGGFLKDRNPATTVVELEGADHMAIVKRSRLIQSCLSDWLRSLILNHLAAEYPDNKDNHAK